MNGPTGPCELQPDWLEWFIVIMNTFQAIAVAFIMQRAVRKNREDRRANGNEPH